MKQTPNAFFSKAILIFNVLILFNNNSFGQVTNWKVNGNTSITGDYIGSNNNEDFIIKTNGTTAVKVKANGNFILKSLESLGAGLATFDNNGKIIPLVFPGDNSQILLGDGTFGSIPVNFWTDGSGSKIYYNGGKVGIGTATPNYKLDVNGDVHITNNLYLDGGMVISEKIQTPKQMKAMSIVADSILMDTTKAFYGVSKFKGDVQLKYKLDVTGPVNFTGPAALNGGAYVNGPLVTNGNITFAGNKSLSYVSASGSTPAIFGFGTVIGGGILSPCLSGIPTTITLNQFNGMLQSIGTPPGETPITMSMGSNGTDGIIDVAGASATNPGLLINYYCGKNVSICTGSNGGNVVMTTAPAGTVAIGDVTVPTGFKFSVTGNSNVSGNTNVTGNSIINGDVGIGTDLTSNTDGYKLAVNGGIRAKYIKVNAGWADYVFEKKYNLMSLNELDKFISSNGHLPNVPTSAEIEKNGADLGKIVELQMQKIEELTLYIIELNKKIESNEKK